MVISLMELLRHTGDSDQFTSLRDSMFRVRVPSRHPKSLSAYDTKRAGYDPEYVNPKVRTVGLTSKLEERGVKVPDEIAAYEWIVEQVGSSFRTRLKKDRNAEQAWAASVSIPFEGLFKITSKVFLRNGNSISVTQEFRLRDFLIVSLGDSFSSGQGNPDQIATPSFSEKVACEAVTFKKVMASIEEIPIVGVIASGLDEAGQIVGGIVDFFSSLFGGDESRPPRWQEPRAYRSYNSAPSLAAMELRNSSPTGADTITFLSFARSGAQIHAGLIGPRENGRDNWIGRGEIDEARRAVAGRRIDALLISIGGNDIGFAGSLNDLVKKDLLTWFGDGEVRAEARKKAEKKLEELPKALDELKREIDSKLNPRSVFMLEYPIGLFEITKDGKTRDGGPCGVFSSSLDFDLDIDEGRLVKRLGEKLNQTIRRNSEEFGWIFISGIAEAFSGRGYCASQSFWISAEESCRNQGDFEGMMHPNAKGHDVIKNRIVEALTTHVLE